MHKSSHALAFACLSLAPGCGDQLDGSPEPMGDRIELGEACEQAPIPAAGTAPNIVGFDQYGELIDLYAHLCDRHVIVLRAGFD